MKTLLLAIALTLSLGSASAQAGLAYAEASPAAESIVKGPGDPILSFYPNPVLENLNIKFQERGDHTIIIYNMLGEKMLTGTVIDGDLLRLDVSDLKKGVYFISYDLGGKVITKTFSKREG